MQTKRTRYQLPHRSLVVWDKAVELVRGVSARRIGVAELRNQATRAAISVGLNVSEGAALEGAARRRHFCIARGSVCEVAAAYELAAAMGEGECEGIEMLCNDIAAMLSGLMRRG